MMDAAVFVGIDVSKAQLDIALRPVGTTFSVAHDDAGMATLIERLRRPVPTLIVLEATAAWRSWWSVPWWRQRCRWW